MNEDLLLKWITMFSAIIAAVVSILNLWLSHKGKTDKFRVGLYFVRPDVSPGHVMHVVSLSDQPIEIVDFGFIYEDGNIESLPFACEVGEFASCELIHHGCTTLKKRGDFFESGFDVNVKQVIIGAFARSITQQKNKYYFLSKITLFERVKFWSKRRKILVEAL